MAKEVNVKLNLQGVNEAEKALNKFGLTVDDLKENEVEPLSFAIGELEDQLYSLASAGKQGSDEFKAISAEVGRMKKVIVDVDLAVDGLAMSTSQQLGGSLQGVASGFALAQGAMGAFGAESEEVEQMILKVQSAMAISEGISGLKEASASFSALGKSAKKALAGIRTGIAATGIGVLLVALGAIVAYWDDIKSALTGVNSEQAKLNEAAQKNAAIEREKLDSLGSQDNILRSQGFTEKQILEMKIKQTDQAISAQEVAIQTAETTLKSQVEAAKKNKEFLKGALQFIMAPLDLLMKGVDKVASVFGAEWNLSDSLRDWEASLLFDPEGIEEKGMAAIDEQKKTLDKMRNDRAGMDLQVKAIDKAAYERRKAERDKEAEENKSLLDEKLAQEKAFQDELNRMKKEADLARMEEEEELSEIIRQAQLDERTLELEELDTHYFNLIERARQHGLDVTALEEEQRAKTKTLQDGWRQEDADAKKAANDKEIQDRLNKEQASVAMASDALDAINGLVQAFAGDNEKAQRRAFVVDKAVNIAKAVMNTATGVSQALASSPPPLSFVQAGITAAAGAAQIATIAKTKFQASGGGSTSVPTPPTGGAARPANFNIIGNSGTNQLAESLGNQTMKAYVVGSEVTTQQSLDRNRVKNASI